jgi:glutamyl-tRNA synthetase
VSGYRGRFAPSPTGELHLGSAAAALATWLAARVAGGRLALRVEDLDTPRVLPGSAERQMEDLRWLGLDWDEGPDVGGRFAPYRQSERAASYETALEELRRAGLTYLCDCSRTEIARVASAPHAGDDSSRYPGTCRRFGHEQRAFRRPPAVRLAVPQGEVVVRDRFQGEVRQDVARAVGDFVLRRGDGVWAYQLAVVVDDLAMRVTEVVRGADLLDSAPRQALLARLLGGEPPSFAHVPLVLAPDGSRLAKRAPGLRLRDHRDAGVAPERLIAELARMLGLLAAGDPRTAVAPDQLVAAGVLERLSGRATVRVPASLATPSPG